MHQEMRKNFLFVFQVPQIPSSSLQPPKVPMDHLSPTSANPNRIPFPCDCNFRLTFPPSNQVYRTKNWDFSVSLNKLYIDMNKWVQVKFHCAPLPLRGCISELCLYMQMLLTSGLQSRDVQTILGLKIQQIQSSPFPST